MSTEPGKKTAPTRCEHCGGKEKVRHDKPLGLWLCDWCWVKTPIPPPKPRRP